MNFNRNIDPKESMKIGNLSLRDFDKKTRELRDKILLALNNDEFNIMNFSFGIDDLKNVIFPIIRNYLERKYKWIFYDTKNSIGKTDISKEFTLDFIPSSQSTSFKIRIEKNHNGISDSNYINSFSGIEKELKKISKIVGFSII